MEKCNYPKLTQKPLAHKNQLLTKAIYCRKPITHECCLLPKADSTSKSAATASQSLFNEITSLST